MDHFSYSKDAELVIGLVAPVGVNLDDVQNRLDSVFRQFRYTVDVIRVCELAKKYVPATREPLSPLSYLESEVATVIRLDHMTKGN